MRSCDCSLLTVIVKQGKASKILSELKESGVRGGTILYGHGTSPSEFLHLLELYEIKKELLLMVVPSALEDKLHDQLDQNPVFNRNNGLAFSIPLVGLKGTHIATKDVDINEDRDFSEYDLVVSVVEKDMGEDIIEYAHSVGAPGATIVKGRGSGIKQEDTLFNLRIEPEKELVLMVTQRDKTAGIKEVIDEKTNLDQPGTGILFVMPIHRATGKL